MNRKSTFVVVVISALFLAAVLARNGEFLLLAIPFLVYLVIGVLMSPDQLVLRAQRTVEESSLSVDGLLTISTTIENQGKALRRLRLADSVPGRMSVIDGYTEQTFALPPAGTMRLEYEACAKRGFYSWNVIPVTAGDPFGLFEVKCEVPAAAELRVHPPSVRLRSVGIRPRSTLHLSGSTLARLAGPGTDFWGIREYRPGDPLRHLNWRLTGRHSHKLFTNEYEGEEIADFGIVLDARRLTKAPDVDEALFEASISAAASLSEAFLKKGNRVGLLVFGESPLYLLPGYGKQQLSLVLSTLARANLSRNLPGCYLQYFPARLFPSRSMVLLFSVVDKGDVETYRRLLSFGYEVLLISPDPIEYACRTLPATAVNSMAVRASHIERIVQLRTLMKMGLSVIDWQIGQPLDMILQSTARELVHRRNL